MRQLVAVDVGKVAGMASRLVGRGGGTALPGLLALAIAPNLVARMAARLPGGCIVISGTNGKTTTSRILNTILIAAGHAPLRNTSGSNLMRGVASALVAFASKRGTIPADRALVGLFEVDEAALPQVAREIRPSCVLLLDLFRDQLDRYGEVATVARLWTEALAHLPEDSMLVANADDPLVTLVALESGVQTTFFGIENVSGGFGVPEHSSDVKSCPRCGGEIHYDSITFGHLGHYRCTRCDFARPSPAVAATNVGANGLAGSTVTLTWGDQTTTVAFPLPGLYNVYNALGAAAVALSRRVSTASIVAGLERTAPAFGRMEHMRVGEAQVYLALAKNPAGFNEVLRTVTQSEQPVHLLVMLNDNLADGRDVSWIWDSDVEILQGHVGSVVFGGTRAEDMALRFKYAGLFETVAGPHLDVINNTSQALECALRGTPPGETLFVIPTYTALLDVRRVLTKMGHARAFWEE
ncbi:MAG: MurT ligase domain-containing protein [Chloroflexota bacterium]